MSWHVLPVVVVGSVVVASAVAVVGSAVLVVGVGVLGVGAGAVGVGVAVAGSVVVMVVSSSVVSGAVDEETKPQWLLSTRADVCCCRSREREREWMNEWILFYEGSGEDEVFLHPALAHEGN